MNFKKIIFFASSFFAAGGNLAFIMTSSEKTLSYVFTYNLGSLTVGLITHLAIPLLLVRMQFTRVVLLYTVFLLFCSSTTLMIFGVFEGAIIMVLMLTLAFEYFAVRTDQLISVIVFRVVNICTGLLPLLLTDDAAIIVRLGCFFVCTMFLAHRIVGLNLVPKGTVDLSGKDFVYVMFVNVVWVYLFPLLLLEDATTKDTKVIYLATTVLPLVFFKIQDTLMKIDVFSSSGRTASSSTVIQISGMALCITYVGLGFLLAYLEVASLMQTVGFIVASIASALLNMFFMKRILGLKANSIIAD